MGLEPGHLSGKDEENVSNEALGCTIDGGQDGKTEILATIDCTSKRFVGDVFMYNRSWPGWQNGNPGLNSDAQACCVLGYRRRSEQQAMVRPRCCLSRRHFNRAETLGALHRPRLRTAAQSHPPANRSCSDRLVLLA